jgi:pilus assembly protein CpaE
VKRILVADDEPDALKMLSLTLRVEGYDVITASNGEEALRLTASERPDLVLLDVMMPKLDGYEVARCLRSMPEFVRLPILFLSARGQVVDKVEGFAAGGNDYVIKPANPRELVARIASLVGAFESTGHLVTVFGSKAGVGCTTVCVNLALALHDQLHASVVLVDGHEAGGDVGVFLNLPHSHHVGELAARPDALDADLYESVLLAPPDVINAPSIDPSAWERILYGLRQMTSYVVFDGPPLHSASWTPVLDMADDILLVITPEITAMRPLTPAHELARSRAKTTGDVHVVLNRYTEGSGFSMAAITRALGFPIHVTIEDVGPINTFAINHGKPLYLSDKRNPITRAVSGLAREIGQRAGQSVGDKPK